MARSGVREFDVTRELSTAALKASPPIGVSLLNPNLWVAVFTIAYIVLQGAHLIWKWRNEVRARKGLGAPAAALAGPATLDDDG